MVDQANLTLEAQQCSIYHQAGIWKVAAAPMRIVSCLLDSSTGSPQVHYLEHSKRVNQNLSSRANATFSLTPMKHLVLLIKDRSRLDPPRQRLAYCKIRY
jgi:hypothetical protein